MTRKTKGRAGCNQCAASNTISNYSYFTLISNHFKALIVTMAVWGLIPIGWVDRISDREDKDNE
jgi:hypothetical protein